MAAHEVTLELGARRVVAGMSLECRNDLAHEHAILREGDRMKRIERFHQRDHIVVSEEGVNEMSQGGASTDRRLACPYVKLVEKDSDGAAAATLQAHRVDRTRFT